MACDEGGRMIFVIGTGPGDGRYALPPALETIGRCGVLAGYPGSLEHFSEGSGRAAAKRLINLSSESGLGLDKGLELIDGLESETPSEIIGIIVSGDPGFHSLLATVKRKYPRWKLQVIPGISAFQAACAKIALPWQDLELIYLHGSGSGNSGSGGLESFIRENPLKGCVILTGSVSSPARIAEDLSAAGFGGRKVWLCMDIGEDNEKIELLRLDEIPGEKEGRLCTMILPPEE